MNSHISLDYFTNGNELNKIIAENMIDISMLQQGYESFEQKAVFCFIKAYEICDEITKNFPSIWKIPDYFKLASYPCANIDLVTIMKAVTMSMVYIYIEHFPKGWRDTNIFFIKKIEDSIYHLAVKGENEGLIAVTQAIRPSVCANAFRSLRRGTNIDIELSIGDFYIPDFIAEVNEAKIQKRIDEAVKKAVDEIPVSYSEVIGTTLHLGTMPKKEYDALNKAKGNGEQISIAKLKKENAELKEKDTQQTIAANDEKIEEQAQTIQELQNEIASLKEQIASNKSTELNRIKEIHENTLVALLKPAFYNIEDDARDFLRRIQGLDNQGVTDVARQFYHDKKISESKKGRFIWRILTAAKMYDRVEQNWTAALRKAN